MNLIPTLATAAASTSPEAVRLPASITQEQLQYMTDLAAIQVFAALVLTVAVLLAIAAAIAIVFDLRRTALAFMALFGLAVFFIPSGYCPYYGGTIMAICSLGFLKRSSSRASHEPSRSGGLAARFSDS